MKKIITILFILLCAAHSASAQKFLDDLQKKQQGQGSVTVTQSKEITDLVNGTSAVKGTPNNTSPTTTTPQDDKTAAQKEKEKEDSARLAAEKERARILAEKEKKEKEDELEIPVIDTRKKVMKNSYKIDGYRVQAFTGGNTRNDRIKAEQIRDKLKAAFPDQPIYTHFYSPRWICRMGNYRTYNEANSYCKKLKAMGYKQACVVKGKITVQ
jgi:hypothetical protein